MERYVIMKFREGKTEEFLSLFESKKHLIASFHGCEHLELLRSEKHPDWFMTFSIWKNEDCLENYRKSVLFEQVWSKVKPLFCYKAEALSVFPELEGDVKKRKEFLAKFEN